MRCADRLADSAVQHTTVLVLQEVLLVHAFDACVHNRAQAGSRMVTSASFSQLADLMAHQLHVLSKNLKLLRPQRSWGAIAELAHEIKASSWQAGSFPAKYCTVLYCMLCATGLLTCHSLY